MAVNNPMAEYNKNNPFVIQMRQNYESMMDQYVVVIRKLLTYAGVLGVTACLAFVPFIIVENYKAIVIAIALTIIHVIYGFQMGKLVINNTVRNPLNKKVDDIVSLQMQEILNLNLEDIYNTNGNIREHLGFISGMLRFINLLTFSSIVISIAIAMIAFI